MKEVLIRQNNINNEDFTPHKDSHLSKKPKEESGLYVLCLGVLPVSFEGSFQKTNNNHNSKLISEEGKPQRGKSNRDFCR